jgi:arsenite methyltransferase
MTTLFRLLCIALSIVGGLALIWLVVLKIISRAFSRFEISAPCPASFSWILDNPIRRNYMKHVLDYVGLVPGERALELGPGPGIFTVDVAYRVGEAGHLTIVDIQPEMITQVEERVHQAGLKNVETHVASAYELPVTSKSVDRGFLVAVLPEIPDQDRALAELHRVIKPGGILSIIEEFMDPDYLFLAETIRRVEKAGFRFYAKQGNWWLYTANFARL